MRYFWYIQTNSSQRVPILGWLHLSWVRSSYHVPPRVATQCSELTYLTGCLYSHNYICPQLGHLTMCNLRQRHPFKSTYLPSRLYSNNHAYTELSRLTVCHLGQRHLFKSTHLIEPLYLGNRAYTKLGHLTVFHLGWLHYSIYTNLSHIYLQRTSLLLVTSLKKPFLGKKSVTSNRNIVFKGKKWKSRYLNWNKTWDLLHSVFVGWLLHPKFPTYMCRFQVPQLHGMGQTILETACSRSDRGGPSSHDQVDNLELSRSRFGLMP